MWKRRGQSGREGVSPCIRADPGAGRPGDGWPWAANLAGILRSFRLSVNSCCFCLPTAPAPGRHRSRTRLREDASPRQAHRTCRPNCSETPFAVFFRNQFHNSILRRKSPPVSAWACTYTCCRPFRADGWGRRSWGSTPGSVRRRRLQRPGRSGLCLPSTFGVRRSTFCGYDVARGRLPPRPAPRPSRWRAKDSPPPEGFQRPGRRD